METGDASLTVAEKARAHATAVGWQLQRVERARGEGQPRGRVEVLTGVRDDHDIGDLVLEIGQ